jgi:uncharacterized protein
MERNVVWSALPWPGTEHVRWTEEGRIQVDSHAVHGLPEGPARVSYRLTAEPDGRTRHLTIEVAGPARTGTGRLLVHADGEGEWTDAQGAPIPALSGCIDVDISTSPLTNTLPIRRLGLTPGASADLNVVYVAVPDLEPQAVPQRYTRLDDATYRYESESFRADLPVDDHDLVIDYPRLWRRWDGTVSEV